MPPNKRLQPTAPPLRFGAAAETRRWAALAVLDFRRGHEMYGETKISYVVVEKPNGRIEVQVWNSNQAVRGEIALNQSNPRHFLKYLEFDQLNPRAKYWLSRVVKDHRAKFRDNLVDFVLK